MSSILRALKKVDGTQPEPRGTEAWSHTFDTAETIRKRAGRSRGVRKAFSLLLLMLVLGAGVWWFYIQPLTGTDGVRKRVAGVTAGRSEEKASSEARVGPRARVSVRRTPAPETAMKSESRPRPLSPDGSILPASVSKTPSRPEDARKGSNPPGRSKVAQAASTPLAAAEKSAGMGRLDNNRFKLEAIVWSNNPDSRFAVINGNILRVGGSMDGVTVTDIERDSVRIRSKNEVGELHFNLE